MKNEAMQRMLARNGSARALGYCQALRLLVDNEQQNDANVVKLVANLYGVSRLDVANDLAALAADR